MVPWREKLKAWIFCLTNKIVIPQFKIVLRAISQRISIAACICWNSFPGKFTAICKGNNVQHSLRVVKIQGMHATCWKWHMTTMHQSHAGLQGVWAKLICMHVSGTQFQHVTSKPVENIMLNSTVPNVCWNVREIVYGNTVQNKHSSRRHDDRISVRTNLWGKLQFRISNPTLKPNMKFHFSWVSGFFLNLEFYLLALLAPWSVFLFLTLVFLLRKTERCLPRVLPGAPCSESERRIPSYTPHTSTGSYLATRKVQ